uniref:Uncharacterized protein n=1 Tax=Batrachochytrium dendrobatidis (strain JAM81 / FGSC 10211) TaxID=684364 RepID=F4PF85_BATDJ|eukprot:XP_006683268.1 hypothetical protein BATDEDRAFT_93034 [Batrachochytrium dendrobatidis JAM81]
MPQALKFFEETAPTMPSYLRYVAPTGIARLALYMNPDDFLPIAEKGTYTEENLKMTKAITAWKGYNENIVDEANEINNNIDKTIDITFPSNIPLMIFTTKDETANKGAKTNITFYNTQLDTGVSNKLITMEGHHYLHWKNYKEMSDQKN